MRTFVTTAIAVWFATSATLTVAVTDPASDRIGIYFDADATQQNIVTWDPYVTTIFVVVTNPTFSNVYGWQAAIRGLDAGTMTVFGTGISGGGFIAGSNLQFDITCTTPLVAQPVTVLASVFGMPNESMQRSCLVLTGTDQPAIPEMLPLIWTEPNQPAPIQVAHLYPNGVAAVINEQAIPEAPGCWSAVAVQSTSWSTLKALFVNAGLILPISAEVNFPTP